MNPEPAINTDDYVARPEDGVMQPFLGAHDETNIDHDTSAQSEHRLKTEEHSHDKQDNPWMDESGAPLQEGAEYELKSSQYAVPDRVTIDAILPNKLTFTIHSGDVDYQDEISHLDLETNGYSFVPVGAEVNDSMSDPATNVEPIRPGQDSGAQVTDLSEPFARAASVWDAADSDFQAPPPPAPGDDELIEEHIGGMHFEAAHHSCPWCIGATQGFGAVEDGLPLAEASFTGDRAWLMEGSDVDVDPNLMAKLAGKDYTPREQREFIDESGSARNLDRLDLAGTHYVIDDIDEDCALW